MSTVLSLQNGASPLPPPLASSTSSYCRYIPQRYFSLPNNAMLTEFQEEIGRDYPLELNQIFKWHHGSSPFTTYQAGLCANTRRSPVSVRYKSGFSGVCAPSPCWSAWEQRFSKPQCPHLHNDWFLRQKMDARINRTREGKCSIQVSQSFRNGRAAGFCAYRASSYSPASVIGPLCPHQHHYS